MTSDYQPPEVEFISYVHPGIKGIIQSPPLEDAAESNKVRINLLQEEIKRARAEHQFFEDFIENHSQSMQIKR